MPSATHAESPTLSSGKKRRWDGDAEDARMPLYGLQNSASLGVPRAEVFSIHRFAQPGNDTLHDNVERIMLHNISPSRKIAPDFSEPWQRKIRPLPSTKRVRVSDDSRDPDQTAKPEYEHSNYSTPPISPQIRPQAGARTTSSALLSPCHICHRKPTKKSDLDSFADCEGCGQRTCYVCIRQCPGWLSSSAHTSKREASGEDPDETLSRSFTMQDVDDEAHRDFTHENPTLKWEKEPNVAVGWNGKGHGSVVCSRCCVERGSEGDVMCLGCLAHMEGT